MTLLLASTSRYRADLLRRLGLPFTQAAPHCDEDAWKSRGLAPQALAEELALAKAESLRAEHPQATIIGSDQLAALELDGAWLVLGKPRTAENAVAQLTLLAGRSHLLITALAVLHDGQIHRHTDLTRLTMRPLDRAALTRYVAADAPLDCAGSYKLEQRGIALFSAIASDDHSGITGLPLIALTRILADLGYPIP